MPSSLLEAFDWQRVCPLIEQRNPKLAGYLQHCLSTAKETSHEPLFISAHYPYGDSLVEQGMFRFPSLAGSGDIYFAQQTLDIQKEKPQIPIGIVLDNILEVSVTKILPPPPMLYYDQRLGKAIEEKRMEVCPIRFLRPGDIFGTFEHCDRKSSTLQLFYDVTSGSRLVRLLFDKNEEFVREFRCFKNLATQIDLSREWKFFEQGKLFPDFPIIREICRQAEWKTHVLFIPPRILEPLNVDTLKYDSYIDSIAWEQSAHMRTRFIDELVGLDIGRGDYDELLDKVNIKKVYKYPLAKTLQKIDLVRKGWALALQPVLIPQDEQSGPFHDLIEKLQYAWSEAYKKAHRSNCRSNSQTTCLALLQFQDFLGGLKNQRPLYLPFGGYVNVVRKGTHGDMQRVASVFNTLEGIPTAFPDVRFFYLSTKKNDMELLEKLTRMFIPPGFLNGLTAVDQSKLICLDTPCKFFHGFIQIEIPHKNAPGA